MFNFNFKKLFLSLFMCFTLVSNVYANAQQIQSEQNLLQLEQDLLEINTYMNNIGPIIMDFNEPNIFDIELSRGEIATITITIEPIDRNQTTHHPMIVGNHIARYTINFPGSGAITHEIYFTVTYVPNLNNNDRDQISFYATSDYINAVPVAFTTVTDSGSTLTTGYSYARSEGYVTFEASGFYLNVYPNITIMPAGNTGNHRNQIAISTNYRTW